MWPAQLAKIKFDFASWTLSTSMDVHFCLEAVEEAIDRHGAPEIVNTNRGSQFTSQAFTGLLGQPRSGAVVSHKPIRRECD